MFVSTADLENFDCYPHKCAWAYEDGCAVVTLARCLDDLDKNGIVTCPEEVD